MQTDYTHQRVWTEDLKQSLSISIRKGTIETRLAPHYQTKYYLKDHPTRLPTAQTDKDLGHFEMDSSLITLYKTSVQPRLEYANQAWTPDLKTRLKQLKMYYAELYD